jgi:hypothetical protein
MVLLSTKTATLYQQQLLLKIRYFSINRLIFIFQIKYCMFYKKYVSKFQLRKVDADVTVAIEYCFAFLYN